MLFFVLEAPPVSPGNSTVVMNSDKRVLFILTQSLYKDLDKIGRISYIIDEDGRELISSNRSWFSILKEPVVAA
jgi:hypothetical protein